MSDVLILVDGEPDSAGLLIPDFPDILQALAKLSEGIASLKQVIQTDSTGHTITVLPNRAIPAYPVPTPGQVLLPLTLDLPAVPLFQAWLAPGHLYQVCRQIDPLRQQVTQQLGYPVGSGNYWLPLVLTTRGPLYAEVIGVQPGTDLTYYQPMHLSDRWRQPLYRLGQSLLKLLQATPATYLIQFGIQGQEICFDRIYPFPASPAIASLAVQIPDLFTCHWRCLTGQPIRDLRIPAKSPYQVLPIG